MAELVDETTTYSIAEAAERLGLTTDTLRYYERDGLLVRRPTGPRPDIAATPRTTSAESS